MSDPIAKPELVVFDLGGVLIRICRSWSEACLAAGLPVRVDSSSISASGRRHELSERHGVGAIDSEEFFRAASHAMAGLYTPEEVRCIHDAWLLGEYPGVGSLISGIRGAGLRTGVLSNTNHAHWMRLAPPSHGGRGEFDSLGQIEHLHASHIMGLLKPDAGIYREFEQRTGFGGRGREILFFDDLAENVEAARACGWQAEQIDHTGDTSAQMHAHLSRRGVPLKYPG